MKSLLPLLLITLSVFACTNNENTQPDKINSDLLLESIQVLAHDSLEGRGFGTKGNQKGRKYLAQQFDKIGVPAAFEAGYDQSFEHTISKRLRQRRFPIENPSKDYSNVPDTTLVGGNIIARVAGITDKVILITAHHDHLGVYEGNIYNGADDDASGTAALLAIADYFKSQELNHTLIIAAVDGEEIGSPGAKYLAANFPGGIENVVLNINMDMIAHNDSSTLWASGVYHYPNLKEPLEKLITPLKLYLGHDDPTNKALDDWTRSSDHRIFHDLGIPFIYFGVEDHEDYHRPTDTFENINQEFYVEATKLIIQSIAAYDSHLFTAE
jgi:hypothetical protein